MKKVSLVIIVILYNLLGHSQNTCPAGYTERDVQCNGQITKRCVPENFNCSKCYILEFAPCPGKNGGSKWGYNSYERASSAAKSETSNWKDGKCIFYDNKNYKIYIDDSKFCSNSISNTNKGGTKFNFIFFNSVMKLVNDLKEKIARIRQSYDDFPTVDRAEPGLIGYLKFIKDAEEVANKAKAKALEYQRQPMQEIEDALKSTVVELNNYNSQANQKITALQSGNKNNNDQNKTSGTFDGGTWKKLPNGMYEVITGGDEAEIISAADFKSRYTGNKPVKKNNESNSADIKALQDVYNVLEAQLKQIKINDPSIDTKEIETQLANLKQQLNKLKQNN